MWQCLCSRLFISCFCLCIAEYRFMWIAFFLLCLQFIVYLFYRLQVYAVPPINDCCWLHRGCNPRLAGLFLWWVADRTSAQDHRDRNSKLHELYVADIWQTCYRCVFSPPSHNPVPPVYTIIVEMCSNLQGCFFFKLMIENKSGSTDWSQQHLWSYCSSIKTLLFILRLGLE